MAPIWKRETWTWRTNRKNDFDGGVFFLAVILVLCINRLIFWRNGKRNPFSPQFLIVTYETLPFKIRLYKHLHVPWYLVGQSPSHFALTTFASHSQLHLHRLLIQPTSKSSSLFSILNYRNAVAYANTYSCSALTVQM